MGKNKQNLNEEINRIKSLFGENLLWGNLINEDCDNTQDALNYLEAMGYVCASPGSSSASKTKQTLINCLEVPFIDKIYNIIKGYENDVNIEVDKPNSTIGCVLFITPKDKTGDYLNITITQSGDISFYYIFEEGVSLAGSGQNLRMNIPSIRYQAIECTGTIDENGNYTIYTPDINSLYNTSFKKISGSKQFGIVNVRKYKNAAEQSVKIREILYKNYPKVKSSGGNISELLTSKLVSFFPFKKS